MIGLGTQSGYDEAQAFSRRYGITFRMFWDRDFDSWNEFAVWGQPTSILVSRGGTQIKRWQGVMTDQQREDAARLGREQG